MLLFIQEGKHNPLFLKTNNFKEISNTINLFTLNYLRILLMLTSVIKISLNSYIFSQGASKC